MSSHHSKSFHHSEVILNSFRCHPIILKSFYHSEVIPKCYSNVIPSPPLSTPPSLPRFMWNDPGMIFLSFHGQSCHYGMRMNGLEFAREDSCFQTCRKTFVACGSGQRARGRSHCSDFQQEQICENLHCKNNHNKNISSSSWVLGFWTWIVTDR